MTAAGRGQKPPSRPLAAVELTHLHYDEMLERDEKARNIPQEESGTTVASINRWISDARLAALSRVVSGEAIRREGSSTLREAQSNGAP